MSAPTQLHRAWWQWLLLLLGVAAFVWVVQTVDIGASVQLLREQGAWLWLGLLPYAVQIGFDAKAWQVLLSALGQRAAWRELFTIRLASEAVLLSLPIGSVVGESLKPYLLGRREGVPPSQTVATLGAKKTLLVYAEAVYLGLAVVIGWHILQTQSAAIVGSGSLPWLGVAGVVFLIALALGLSVAFIGGSLSQRLHRLLSKIPSRRWRAYMAQHETAFDATDEGFRVLGRAHGANVVAFVHLLIAWWAEALETWILLRLLGADVSIAAVYVMEACVVLTRNMAVFVPAGLGVQDAGYVAFLQAYGAGPVAGAFVIAKRLKELVWMSIGYVLFFWMEARSPTVRLEHA